MLMQMVVTISGYPLVGFSTQAIVLNLSWHPWVVEGKLCSRTCCKAECVECDKRGMWVAECVSKIAHIVFSSPLPRNGPLSFQTSSDQGQSWSP